MGLNHQVSAERVHIGFFGLRNAGKSSLVNRVTGQNLSVVSQVKGTTTDPVRKAMELLPIGPVVIIDTPGLDDEGALGEERVRRARQVLDQTDIAVLVVDATQGLQPVHRELMQLLDSRGVPYVIAHNKADLTTPPAATPEGEIWVSAAQGTNIHALKELIAKRAKHTGNQRELLGDLIAPGQLAVLVTPIDSAAPKGRLILPQQQTIRSILDAGAIPVVTRETELPLTLSSLGRKPQIVITDSQVFGLVDKCTPQDILLTSFSILFARYKGDLHRTVLGAARLSTLQDGDRVLISEGCTHHRQCGDIGTQKLPRWISDYTGKQLQYAFTSGGEFPQQLDGYALVVHCGGCMLNHREMYARLERCAQSQVPVTNYGIAIAQMHGMLGRALKPFPALYRQWAQCTRAEGTARCPGECVHPC